MENYADLETRNFDDLSQALRLPAERLQVAANDVQFDVDRAQAGLADSPGQVDTKRN